MKKLSFLILLGLSPLAAQATSMENRIEAAIQMLEEKQTSSKPIPEKALRAAQGIAFIRVTKAGLIVGGQGGSGIVVQRYPTSRGSAWSAPCAFDLSGGSFGLQIGGETQNLIVLLNTLEAVRMFTGGGSPEWDGSLSSTIGDTTGLAEHSELGTLPIVLYASNSGFYGGATIGANSLYANRTANGKAYGKQIGTHDILRGYVKPPQSAQPLYALLPGIQSEMPQPPKATPAARPLSLDK